MKKNLLNNQIVEKYKIWFLLPLIIMLVSFFVFAGFTISSLTQGKKFGDSLNDGFNIGIDFEGGTILTVTLGQKRAIDEFDTNKKEINKIIKKVTGLTPSYVQKSNSGAEASIVFKFDSISSDKASELRTEIGKKYFPKADPELVNNAITSTTIGSSASQDLVWTAVVSIIVSTILILIYVIIRFEFWSAISAVLALCHDVLMMVCLTVMFRIQINSSFIAAIITIVAYSINATIVLFDRVRENYKLSTPGSDIKEYNRMICNKSIKETFTRNINTTVTTLVAITVLAIIGDMSIREFAVPVIFGLIVGCYSSMVISPSIFVLLKNKFGKELKGMGAKKEKKQKKAKEMA